MSHLTDEQLSALADGVLEGGARAAAERHLETCPDCRRALAGLVARDGALASSLAHDPGEAYFESFAGRVGGRIRAAGLAGAQAREPGVRSLAEWFRVPRKLALMGALATVVVGAGIVMIVSREARVPVLSEQEIESRVAQEAPPPAPSGSRPLARDATPPAALRPATGATAPRSAARMEKGTALPREDTRAKASVVPGAEPAAPAAADRAPASRAYEVRRNAAGDDVPVGPPGGVVRRPPQAVPTPPAIAPGEPVRVRRVRAAEPLGAGQPADAGSPQVPPSTAGAETRAPTAGPGPFATVGKPAFEEESSRAAGPVMGPVTEPVVTASKEAAAAGRLLGLADRGRALQAPGTPDAFDGLPARSRDAAKHARRLTKLAETIGLAPAWDSAAAAWEQLAGDVQGGPLESETRFQAARGRFMAWQRSAGERRGAQAAQALRAFLAGAPEGAERDSAQAWLARLGK